MLVYLIAIFVTLVCAILNHRMTPAMRKSLMAIICVYVILVFGFRYKVGIDTISYMRAYRFIPTLEELISNPFSYKTRYEPGFLFICSLCKSFTNSFWVLQMVMATIINSTIFIFLQRSCRNSFLGVLFFFLFECLYFNTEILRESAAVGIFLLNYKNLENKKWIQYYLFSIFSILFHYSAIIIWFFPFVRWIKPNLTFIILCICMLAITPLVENLNQLLNIAAISGRIDQYVSGAADLNLNWRIGELIRTALPALAILWGYKYAKQHLKISEMILLQILFCMGAFAIPVIFSRFSNYTYMFVAVGCANLLTLPQIQTELKAIFVALIIMTQSYYYYSNAPRWFPYVSIFQPLDIHKRSEIYLLGFYPWLRHQ